jgi:hypothetical protein
VTHNKIRYLQLFVFIIVFIYYFLENTSTERGTPFSLDFIAKVNNLAIIKKEKHFQSVTSWRIISSDVSWIINMHENIKTIIKRFMVNDACK